MKKNIILILLLLAAYGEIYANEAYFDNCTSIGIDYMMAFEYVDEYNVLSVNDIVNQTLGGHGIVYHSDKYLKDEFIINTSKNIKDMYTDIAKLYIINDIEFLTLKYPNKQVKYQSNNMDIIINPKDDSLLEIIINIQNSHVVSRILIEKQKNKIYIKNINIKEIYNHLNNISKISNMLMLASNNNINTKDFIISYNNVSKNTLDNGSFNWSVIPDYHYLKYVCNGKLYAAKIPLVLNHNIYDTVIINNIGIENAYQMLLKNETELNSMFLFDNLNKKSDALYGLFNTKTNQVTMLEAPQTESMWPQLPKTYIESKYKTNQNMALLNYTSAYINDDMETSTMNTNSYLLIKLNNTVRIIRFQAYY